MSRRPSTSLPAAAVPLAAVLLCLAGPAGAAGPDGAPERAPVRVATLLPFVADALAGVPAHAVVVANVRRSAAAPPLEGVIDLGSPHAPSFERLAESGAQLVVADRAMHATLTDKLARGGADVVLVDTTSIDATMEGLREVGRRVGAAEEMDRAVAEARAGIAAQALPTPVATLPFFGAPGSFLVITDRTWLGDLLEELAFENLAADSTGKESFPGYVQVSDEVIAAMRPELVVLVAHGDPDAIRTAFLRRAEGGGPWQSFNDARHGVHVLDAAAFTANPGLAIPEAAAKLRRLVAAEAAAAK